MLKDDIKQGMIDAMKAGRAVEKNILKLAMGEIQTIESRGAGEVSDDDVGKILRKIIKSNEESAAATEDAEKKATLVAEVEILSALLPKTLTPEEIQAALEAVEEQILGAGNDGQATGMAMKHLKSSGANVEGKDVSAAVRAMRA